MYEDLGVEQCGGVACPHSCGALLHGETAAAAHRLRETTSSCCRSSCVLFRHARPPCSGLPRLAACASLLIITFSSSSSFLLPLCNISEALLPSYFCCFPLVSLLLPALLPHPPPHIVATLPKPSCRGASQGRHGIEKLTLGEKVVMCDSIVENAPIRRK